MEAISCIVISKNVIEQNDADKFRINKLEKERVDNEKTIAKLKKEINRQVIATKKLLSDLKKYRTPTKNVKNYVDVYLELIKKEPNKVSKSKNEIHRPIFQKVKNLN